MPPGNEESGPASNVGPARGARAAGPEAAALPPPEVRAELRPWVDVDAVGLPGLWVWLRTVLPLLPPPSAPGSAARGPVWEHGGADRVRDLAEALVQCAGDRARLNFRASEYYVDNTVLARRVRALEGMLRASGKPTASAEDDPDLERVTERYLPGRSREGRP